MLCFKTEGAFENRCLSLHNRRNRSTYPIPKVASFAAFNAQLMILGQSSDDNLGILDLLRSSDMVRIWFLGAKADSGANE